MPDGRGSAPPRGRAPAHHEPDRGGWPLGFGLDGRSYRCRFDNPQKSFLDGVVDTQSSECDAAWLAIVERTPPTGIARNIMLGACVADRQLASATPAAAKAGE